MSGSPQVLDDPVAVPPEHWARCFDAENQEHIVDDTLRMLGMFPAVNEGHWRQLLALVATFADCETRYDYDA
jgi:hypothetical protein